MPIFSATWKAEAENYNFKSILDNIMKPCLKKVCCLAKLRSPAAAMF